MQTVMKVLTAVIFVIFFALACTNWNTAVKVILFIAGAALLRMSLKIKCIEYEFSGECITIKKFHPFYQRKKISPFAEFPRQYLRDFTLEEKQMVCTLVIVLDTDKRKGFKVKLQIAGFNDRQMKDLTDSLETIKKINNNEH